MTTYLTISREGRTETRNTQTREYVAAIWTGTKYNPRGKYDLSHPVEERTDGVIGFSGTMDNAEKTRRKWLDVYPAAYVVPAIRVEFEKNDPRYKPKWQATGYTGNGEKSGIGYGPTKTAALDSISRNLTGE